MDFKWDDQSIDNLEVYLQEIAREERKQQVPLYKFVDLGYVNLLTADRNHVVFGRRGSGKSALLRELESRCYSTNTYPLLIDMEQVAQKSYPNLIIEILRKIFGQLHNELDTGFLGFFNATKRNLTKDLSSEIDTLNALSRRADTTVRKKREQAQQEVEGSFGPEIAVVQTIINLTAKLSKRWMTDVTFEEEESWAKIRDLFNGLDQYRSLLSRWIDATNYDALYLLIDDFYQVDLLHQPLVIDYLKRLLRGVPCYLKIATVRNRSLLFVRSALTEAGMQSGQDYTSIPLDFSLEDFEGARSFLGLILGNVCAGRIGPLSPDALFENDLTEALGLLTEVSGGNPRDFINILRRVISAKKVSLSKTPITNQNIREAAINYFNQVVRSEVEKSYIGFDTLNDFLKDVVVVCRDNSDIGFFVSNRELKSNPVVSSLIRVLVDSRFMHLLTRSFYPNNGEVSSASVFVLALGIYYDYVKSDEVNLMSRRSKERDYAELPVGALSVKYDELAPELTLLANLGSSEE